MPYQVVRKFAPLAQGVRGGIEGILEGVRERRARRDKMIADIMSHYGNIATMSGRGYLPTEKAGTAVENLVGSLRNLKSPLAETLVPPQTLPPEGIDFNKIQMRADTLWKYGQMTGKPIDRQKAFYIALQESAGRGEAGSGITAESLFPGVRDVQTHTSIRLYNYLKLRRNIKKWPSS